MQIDYNTFKAMQSSNYGNYNNYNNYSSSYGYNSSYNNNYSYNANNLFSNFSVNSGVKEELAKSSGGFLSGVWGIIRSGANAMTTYGKQFLGRIAGAASLFSNVYSGVQRAIGVCSEGGLDNPYCRAQPLRIILTSLAGTGAGYACGGATFAGMTASEVLAPYAIPTSIGAAAACNYGAMEGVGYLFDQTLDYMYNAEPAYIN